MKNILGVTLGIMTAMGGFVDIGQMIFTIQAGALFGYQLLWVLVLGTAGIILFSEMAGRIAAIKKKAVADVICDQLGHKAGAVTLIGSNLVNLITCAAEIGGIALVLELLTGRSDRIWIGVVTAVLVAVVCTLRFKWIERTFGLSGLLMVVFIFAAIKLHPDWHAAAAGMIPTLPHGGYTLLLYFFFVVGTFSAVLMPYEVQFYSSGGIEEDWDAESLAENRLVASSGSILGALLTTALLFLGALLFLPRHIFPQLISSAINSAGEAYGSKAIYIAAFGTIAALSGAAVETALSNGYNTAQFFGWKWGRSLPMRQTPRFDASWIVTFAIGMVLILCGVKPLTLVNFSVVFGMVVLPLTYVPILLVARNRKIMGKHANSKVTDFFAWIFLVFIVVSALAAIPLMVMTNSGQP
jgi:manganese transport protein